MDFQLVFLRHANLQRILDRFNLNSRKQKLLIIISYETGNGCRKIIIFKDITFRLTLIASIDGIETYKCHALPVFIPIYNKKVSF